MAALETITKRGDPHLFNGILHAMSDDYTFVCCTAAAAVIRLMLMTIAGSGKKRAR